MADTIEGFDGFDMAWWRARRMAAVAEAAAPPAILTEKLGRWGRRIVKARGCRGVPRWRWDVTTQLRIYTVRPGRLDAWVAAWRTLVVPLRRRFGFEISGSWVDVERQQHIWLVSHPGPQSFEEANAD
ncbi:hypothetical protein AB0869_14840 [Micromonospora vinacea]|uniref:hypothetical protein n=1 Tax=Micromonospora vinacea TaxID=709878 RepID=UPI003455D699